MLSDGCTRTGGRGTVCSPRTAQQGQEGLGRCLAESCNPKSSKHGGVCLSHPEHPPLTSTDSTSPPPPPQSPVLANGTKHLQSPLGKHRLGREDRGLGLRGVWGPSSYPTAAPEAHQGSSRDHWGFLCGSYKPQPHPPRAQDGE